MVHNVFLLPSPPTRRAAPAAAGRRKTTAAAAPSTPTMAPFTQANTPSLKRTYTLVAESNPASPSDRATAPANPFSAPAASPPTSPPPQPSPARSDKRMSLSLKRRYPFCKPHASSSEPSPSAAFASVLDVDMSGCSSASSSSHSSPTTTVSTVDSATTSDEHTTPESSPDSPRPAMPLGAPFKPTPAGHSPSLHAAAPRELSICPPSPGGAHCSRPLSPSKRPRNNKNLSLNLPPQPPTPSLLGPQPQPIPEGSERSTREPTPRSMSAPSSPAFIPPPPPQNPRRRPSNLGLTIKLPGTLPDKTAVRGSLRHHVSSPSMFSPSIRGPPGGMTLPQTASARQTTFNLQKKPSFSRWQGESIASSVSSSSVSNSPTESVDDVLEEMDEEEDEEPRSGETKSPAYPAGPVCIFDPNIYLFAEPDAELAAQFDVVINVAREVINPFKKAQENSRMVPETPAPDTACTDASFKTAFEDAMFSPVALRTRPTSLRPKFREPEYIHMPWDHNTPILGDLPGLVQLISKRADEGKRILVHCQCGVSRSATLLIAYSMFKNPEKTMQDAYSAVKARSKWIGPNMSLIYQLTDWKKLLTDDGLRTAFGWGRGKPGLMKSVTTGGLGRGGNVAGNRASDPLPEPLTAPLPDRRKSPSPSPYPPHASSNYPKPQIVHARSPQDDDTPSSAPPGMITIPQASVSRDNRQSWPDGDSRLLPPTHQFSPSYPIPPTWDFSELMRRPQTFKELPSPTNSSASSSPDIYALERPMFTNSNSPSPPLPERFTPDPAELHPPPSHHQQPQPPPPQAGAITSPRNSGYFGIAKRPAPWGGLFSDPRSPTERNVQSPIIRNIFDVL